MRGTRHDIPCTAAAALLHAVTASLLVSACVVCRADDATIPVASKDSPRSPAAALAPSGLFAQIGVADEVTAATVGAMWSVKGNAVRSRWGVYVEASLSRWNSRDGHPSESGVLTQLSVIPVVRYRFADGGSPWFVEGGIGATVTSSVFRSADKQFSTAFNFGDHVGLGYAFGAARKNELVLRAQHFSNAGIKHPNPGENFVQLRYTHHFD
jgi:lipid A 3-O-deacylase